MIAMKRMYDPLDAEDGYRVLVDRLWPRGVREAAARLDAWEKGSAPSDELRHWYGHDPAQWAEFQARDARELAAPDTQVILDALAARARHGPVALLYASQAGAISNAAALYGMLTQRGATSAREGHGSR